MEGDTQRRVAAEPVINIGGKTAMGENYAKPDALVDTDWVAAHLNDSSVRIVESDEDVLLYDTGHIPGAIRIDWHTELNDPLRRDYLDKEHFEELMRQKGISNDTTRRLLRRQEQLVGTLRLLGLPAVRPRQRQDHERRAQEVDRRRPPA